MKLMTIVAAGVSTIVTVAFSAALPASAASVIDEWASVKLPAPPAVKPVTADPKTTALLMLDFMNQNCGKRPRCLATVPAVKKLLEEARAKKAAVVYTLIAKTTTADVIKDVAPAAGEPSVLSGPDKFLGTDLEKILKDRGIQTVIAVGTSSNGAVLYTASAAALRGMKVIVPVDGMSSQDALTDLVTVQVLTTAPRVSGQVTLTKLDMIKF
jgi:nicotinamidase-related amidase